MKKKKKIEIPLHFAVFLYHRKVFEKNLRKFVFSLLKTFGQLVIIFLLTIAGFSIFRVYNKERAIKSEIICLKNEIAFLENKKEYLRSYKNGINNLLGYDIYQNYVNNNDKK